MNQQPDRTDGAAFLLTHGEMARLIRAHDWTSTALGPSNAWPAQLKALVQVILGSREPMFVAWGPELGFIYNDAYAEILGTKHPAALGARFRDIWNEIWVDILPLIDRAMAGEASYREALTMLCKVVLNLNEMVYVD